MEKHSRLCHTFITASLTGFYMCKAFFFLLNQVLKQENYTYELPVCNIFGFSMLGVCIAIFNARYLSLK